MDKIDPNSETLPASSADAMPAVRAEVLPPVVGRFEIESKLGQGGMGTVLLATDPLLDRRVAIKILRGAADDSAQQRLLREAQSTARLAHENLIVVHEVGTHEDQVYVAMEYVPGETLRHWQAKRGWREVLAQYVRAGRGLQAAHDAGLVHRDFKPDNVLVGSDGRLRVTDFGLVATAGNESEPGAAVDGNSRLTQTGAVMGTPRYMAPEQHLGEPVDARADQFAFCIALYEGLYGRSPFDGESYGELCANALAGNVRLPPSSDVPDRIRDAVLRGLSRQREDRFASMSELLPLLVPDAATRRRWPFAVVGVLVAALGIYLVIAWSSQRAVEPPQTPPVLPPPPPKPEPAKPEPVVEGVLGGELDLLAVANAREAFELGLEAEATKDYDDAAESFADSYKLLALPQALYNGAACLFQQAKREGDPVRYRRAVELYRKYLVSDPISPEVSDRIATIEAEIGRLEGGGDRKPSAAIKRLVDPMLRGVVLVTSAPIGAKVYVDDAAKGVVGITPWPGTLEGEHTILVAKTGYETAPLEKALYRRKAFVVAHVQLHRPK